VTNLEEGDLGQDVVVRFARRRLYSVEGWTILKDVFQAREIDPSLLHRPWLADFVMDALPADGVDRFRPGCWTQKQCGASSYGRVLALDLRGRMRRTCCSGRLTRAT